MAKRRTNGTDWFDHSLMLNEYTYSMWYLRMKNMCLNTVEWVRIPASVDYRFLELQLYSLGQCLYFNDFALGDLALAFTGRGKMDIYNNPISRVVRTPSGYSGVFSPENSVIIYNNYLRQPTDFFVQQFAYRMYMLTRAIDVNISGQRTPKILACTQDERLSIINLYKQYDGNEPFIFASNTLDVATLKAIDLTVPYVADKLEIERHNIWNDFLTFIGVENATQDKKERLVSDEVSANSGNIEAERNVWLAARRQACQQINAMFGADMDVRFNSELQSAVNLGAEVGQNEQVYN